MLYRNIRHCLAMRSLSLSSLGCLLLAGVVTTIEGAPLDPPTPEAVAEGRRIVQEMRDNPRGPYSRIRWYCNDGTVQAPVAYACRERGGGRQHAEYSAARQRLAELGWHVGTVYAALSFDELFESQARAGRLRELPLEQYLIDTDNGWVLERAREYRGRVQVEDETFAGMELLQALVALEPWWQGNFLLLREAARTIPHGADSDLARSIRRDAVQLAELEPAAERWRAEIHSRPGGDIAARLEAWARQQSRPEVVDFATKLARDLDELYGAGGRRARVDEAVAAVRGSAPGDAWARQVGDAFRRPPAEQVGPLCNALADARGGVFSQLDAPRRVALLDAMQELESTVSLLFQEHVAIEALTRRQLFGVAENLVDCAYASGFLSPRERQALVAATRLPDDATVTTDAYREAIATLKRTPGWALGTVRHTFAEALVRYAALEPAAARFSDDLLRGSPLWMFGGVLRQLAIDADMLAGSVTEIAGERGAGAVALNPGVARGTLRIFETLEDVEHAAMRPTEVVVLPETVAELSPVAGILTLGEGNALSHVQLLARNFGIPNVAIDYGAVDLLRPLEGEEVLLLAGSGGDVLLRSIDAELRVTLDTATERTKQSTERIDVPLPDLEVNRVLALPEIERSLSGKVVGPKAANLGELNRLFPGRVAPAVALPFGVYGSHLAAAGLDRRIAAAFADRNAGRITVPEFDAELARVRTEIAALTLDPVVRGELETIMARDFGEAGSYGVFVRSDTNVEDLPQFTGAGLNATVPHLVDTEEQLDAIPQVWSSVLSPRALAWRSNVLANPARIYASVLLMKSVPSTKSGVLVTSNLADAGTPGLTASTAWGVGGAVAGEAAETIVILPASTVLLSEAKAPYQRHLAATGGIDWVPADSGAVLDAGEIEALRRLADEVAGKYEPAITEDGTVRPWDIEFGFVDGELTLFQIRPLVERRTPGADALLKTLSPARDLPADTAALDEPPGSN